MICVHLKRKTVICDRLFNFTQVQQKSLKYLQKVLTFGTTFAILKTVKKEAAQTNYKARQHNTLTSD